MLSQRRGGRWQLLLVATYGWLCCMALLYWFGARREVARVSSNRCGGRCTRVRLAVDTVWHVRAAVVVRYAATVVVVGTCVYTP